MKTLAMKSASAHAFEGGDSRLLSGARIPASSFCASAFVIFPIRPRVRFLRCPSSHHAITHDPLRLKMLPFWNRLRMISPSCVYGVVLQRRIDHSTGARSLVCSLPFFE